MHLGRETTDITLLNCRNSQLCSLVCPSLHITPHETHFTLKQMETTTEGYSQSKGRVVEPIPSRYIYKTFPHLRCRELCKRRGRKTVTVCPLGVSEGTSLQSHQHVCSNVTLTRWHQWTNQTRWRKLMWPQPYTTGNQGALIKGVAFSSNGTLTA